MKILTLLILCLASAALAEDFKAIDGKEYKNVRVSRVEPDGIVLISKSGISKVYFTELPKEVQERFHYDAAQAAAYSTEQAASQQALQNQQAELRRKVAEEKNRYWIGQEPAKNQQAKLSAPAAVVAGRGQQVEVISHGTQVDIAKHLAPGPLILLLIVNPGALKVFALRVGSACGGSATLAIGRNHNSTRSSDSSVIPNGQLQCAVVDLFVRPRV